MTISLRGQTGALLSYNPRSGTFAGRAALGDAGAGAPPGPCDTKLDGWYRWVENEFVALFVYERRVWLRLGARQFPLAGPRAVHWTRQPNGMARLVAFPSDGGEPASFVYFGGDGSGVPPELDFTPTSTTDFDVGEWVYRWMTEPGRLKDFFGEDVLLDSSWSPDPTALAAVAEAPQPARSMALGPLASEPPASDAKESVVEAFDEAALSFVRGQRAAPASVPSAEPAVMPLGLALTDASRKVALEVGRRACARAVRVGDPSVLTDAAVLLVLSGLDCDPSSRSFQEARAGARELAAATTELRVRSRSLIGTVEQRVGPVGAWRLAEAMRTDRRLSRRLGRRLRRASARGSV